MGLGIGEPEIPNHPIQLPPILAILFLYPLSAVFPMLGILKQDYAFVIDFADILLFFH